MCVEFTLKKEGQAGFSETDARFFFYWLKKSRASEWPGEIYLIQISLTEGMRRISSQLQISKIKN